ncbi:dynein regulatory complex protein 11 [Trichonephila clavipes]|uniref:Dynein regulatory complex protein 11 n=1 Tax=Trichonephila clavipes TaxID=2585209 RepID=A0A8X6WHF2_TRICX|nr:dynein regulatory complex protein 11 [Trichonephila clavipes]
MIEYWIANIETLRSTVHGDHVRLPLRIQTEISGKFALLFFVLRNVIGCSWQPSSVSDAYGSKYSDFQSNVGRKVWKDKEIIGIFDKCDVEMIRQEAFQEMEISVRLQTDRIMREELHRLTEAFEKDLGKKGKKGGKKGRKKGGKKEKGKGKGKGKKEKDLTPNRSFESLVEELIKEKIIVDYPKFLLSDFIGDYNYVGSVPDVESDPEKDTMPCLGDIRRILNEYCILPMGSSAIHSKGAYVKSILITGPPGVGKKSLIYAICNEIGATLMDLSAKNVNGKYPGKEGLDMLMHLVFKVGRLAQPTIIYISDAENYFWKKQPTNSILVEAIRLKKELPKLIKGISNDDRIMIIGTTVAPFDVDLKALSSYYSKIICILAPDHNCRRELGLSTLSGVSDGFTAQHIKYAVKKVLTDRRLSLQTKIPLSASEFVHFLSDCTPISQEENEEYRRPCRMIIRHVKDPLSVCLVWVFSAELNPSTGSHRQSSGASNQRGNWASKLPAAIGIRPYGAPLKRDTCFGECTRSAMAWLAKMPLQKKRVKVLKEEAGEIIEEVKNKEKSNTKVP